MASTIDPTLAKSLIKEFQEQNTAAGGPALKTPDGSFINGFFVDRQTLEFILNDPAVVGMSLYHAKDPDFAGHAENVFTLVLAGAIPNTAGSGAPPPYLSTGNFYCNIPPCPPYCSNL